MLLGCALLDRQQLLDKRAYLIAEQARVVSSLAVLQPTHIEQQDDASQARLRLASSELGRDWERLFAPIERAAVPELRLLSIEPDINASSVVITADAPNYEFAVEYTERLGAYGLRTVTLLSHTPTPSADGRVRVRIGANWGAQ